MNLLTLLAVLQPIVNVGGSSILGWLLTLVIIAAIVYFVVWMVTKIVGGPPSVPEPFRWIIWAVVIIALLIFLFAALGIHLP